MKTDLSKEKELIKRAQQGDTTARTQLMELYVPWIRGVCGSKFGREDLMGEAMIVLESLIDKYNLNSPAQFGTYIYPHIINKIDEILSGTYLNGTIRKVKNRRQKFFATYGYEGTPEEIAEEYGIRLQDVKTAYNLLDGREVPLKEDMDFPDEEEPQMPELVIPNGLLTQKEKFYLECYLKGMSDADICRLRKVKQGSYDGVYNSIVSKLKGEA